MVTVGIVHLPDVTFAAMTHKPVGHHKPRVTLRRRTGSDVNIHCRGGEIDARCLLDEIAQRAPWVKLA
jgi:hypothetical protein